MMQEQHTKLYTSDNSMVVINDGMTYGEIKAILLNNFGHIFKMKDGDMHTIICSKMTQADNKAIDYYFDMHQQYLREKHLNQPKQSYLDITTDFYNYLIQVSNTDNEDIDEDDIKMKKMILTNKINATDLFNMFKQYCKDYAIFHIEITAVKFGMVLDTNTHFVKGKNTKCTFYSLDGIDTVNECKEFYDTVIADTELWKNGAVPAADLYKHFQSLYEESDLSNTKFGLKLNQCGDGLIKKRTGKGMTYTLNQ